MKVECLREKLEDVIYKAEKIAGKNLSLPVLKCVLLSAEEGKLTVKSTNLDLGVEMEIKAKVEKKGTLAVPADILSSFLSNSLDERNINLESKKNNLHISNSRNSTTIKALPHEDFPSLPKINDKKSIKIKASDFVKGLRSVWFSSSNSSMKPELSSVYIYNDSGKIFFVSTDSFRLSEKIISVGKVKDFDPILIPFKNVGEIIRILEDRESEEIEIRFGENQIAFVYPGVYLTSRTIDGVFPDYKQIIPKEYTTEAVVLKHDIMNVLKMANIFSDKFNQTTFRIFPSKKSFLIEAQNSEVGENSGKLDAALNGEDLEIGFNYKYVMDCFGSIPSDSASLSLAGKGKPMVIKGVSDDSFTYMVMPMNK